MQKLNINEAISSNEVRLIDQTGKQVGIVKTSIALKQAETAGLDLVEISPEGKPPVAKILDYAKYVYELKNKSRQAKKNTIQTEIKEIRFRLKIDENDYNVKLNKVRKFLEGGDKAKVGVQFRGRENQHTEYGYELLVKIQEELQDISKLETAPSLDGRRMSMVLRPTSKKIVTQSEQRRRGSEVKEKRLERQKAQMLRKAKENNGKSKED